ncbi:MAG TPA: dihydroorotate dehydrogenase electron transfer subunit [Planctomycetaceae bacterium]|jgi:dihydroorotate dehydrogenase electron transfer subunit|nr:dihydroorotate dehydrogenase electron transfer subunit [Planctomycetaceae bacterium]
MINGNADADMPDSGPQHASSVSGSSPSSGLASPNPDAVQQRVRVLAQRQLARDTYALAIEAPEIAAAILPGQFFMVRAVDCVEPLLGRPFALYDTVIAKGQPVGVEFGYTVVGKLTGLMPSWRAGDQVEIWGPLGNGFPPPRGNHLMLVAGGIGQTPFLAVAREALGLKQYGQPPRLLSERPRKLTCCYGVRSAEYLAGLDDFSMPGLDMRLATDDGSRGHHGFVTDLLAEALASADRPDSVYCCGPEPMMHATARLCREAGVACWLSLETPMACGFGACFSCVTAVRMDDGEWDYRRTCVEGPVFAADRLLV